MLNFLRHRLDRQQGGFTLIELMVVVLIIAILMAIAIPSFLGAQSKAKDRSAQADLRNAVSAAKVQATDYSGLFYKAAGTVTDAAALQGVEPSLTFVAGAGTTAGVGMTVASGGTALVLTRKSAAGGMYGAKLLNTGEITYCSGATATTASSTAAAAGACTGGW